MPELLDSRLLQTFAMVAQSGSFGVAAHRLNLTQSAISQQVKALERQVNTSLFDRAGKKLALTNAGGLLLRHAEEILSRLTVAQRTMQESFGTGQGQLRIGAAATVCEYWMPAVVGAFHKRYPKHSLVIEPGYSGPIIEHLLQGHIDLAIIVLPVRTRFLRTMELHEDELMAIVPPHHPWAKKASVPAKEISTQSFILYSSRSSTFQVLEKFCHERGLNLPSIIETGEYGLIKRLVELGVGIAIMAPWMAESELREKRLVAVPFADSSIRRQWGVAIRSGQQLSPSQSYFVGLCRNLIGPRGRTREVHRHK